MAGALIVTAELGASDHAWLDAQRRAHFPPDRNFLSAHLTLFHALPPSAESEVRTALAEAARQAQPPARISGVMNLGRGSAWAIESPALVALRESLADRFRGLLTAQDQARLRPHVTIQNKMSPADARALQSDMALMPMPRSLAIHGLGLHRYMDGPWASLGRWPFRGAS